MSNQYNEDPDNIETLIQAINQEILWCIDNPDRTYHKEYRKGFINGLVQAKYIITEIYKMGNQP